MPDIHDRIVNLERLIMTMAKKPNIRESEEPKDDDQVNPIDLRETTIDRLSDHGSMRASVSELHYVGGEHWAAILDSISDLKVYFDQEEQLRLATSPDQPQHEYGTSGDVHDWPGKHSQLLYGRSKPASQAELLAALPPKSSVDRYISRYFNRQELISCEPMPLSGEISNLSYKPQLRSTALHFSKR
jgi:hypothetical protein